MALEAGVGRIVVDNPTELRRLSAIAGEMGKTAPVYLRITPGVEAHHPQLYPDQDRSIPSSGLHWKAERLYRAPRKRCAWMPLP